MKLAILLTLALVLIAADTPPKTVPLNTTEKLAAQVLTEMSRDLQAKIELVTADICTRAQIPRDKCVIDWEKGVATEKKAALPVRPTTEP